MRVKLACPVMLMVSFIDYFPMQKVVVPVFNGLRVVEVQMRYNFF
jgi:hypothetical protein